MAPASRKGEGPFGFEKNGQFGSAALVLTRHIEFDQLLEFGRVAEART